MTIKLVKVTDKGQVSIPVSMQESLAIQKGDELIMIETDDAIIIKKLDESEFKDLIKHTEKVAAKLWSGKGDDVWDKL